MYNQQKYYSALFFCKILGTLLMLLFNT